MGRIIEANMNYRESGAGGRRTRRPDPCSGIELILLAQEGEHFVMRADRNRIHPFRLALSAGGGVDDVRMLVEKLAKEQLNVDVDYLGLLSAEFGADPPRVVVAAVLRADQDTAVAGANSSVFSLPEVKGHLADVHHAKLYETARDWCQARTIAADLPARIERAFEMSLLYLRQHLSVEDDHWGWNLYMDGGPIGVLSTAEGVLSHLYAGVAGEFVSNPVATLEALQNSDGGWQVRSSLVVSRSDLSVTVSTCECLWALHAVGKSNRDESVQNGIRWLEELQRPDGGWPSSLAGVDGREPRSLVLPTTCAVRALARFERADAVAKGIAWLRGAQRADGGWGSEAQAENGRSQPSSPGYTGYAVEALLDAGLAASDGAVERACSYLRGSFRPGQAEPWESTLSNWLIDPTTGARLDFKNFGTPWALVALSRAGYDFSDPVVLAGVHRLLELQKPEGAWRCDVAPANSTMMWATHDALHALRSVVTSGNRNVAPLALERYLRRERAEMRQLAAKLLAEDGAKTSRRRGRFQTIWLSVVTVVVAMLALAQLDVFRYFQSDSAPEKLGAALVTLITAALGTAVPQLLTEEYRIRRTRDHGSGKR